MKHKRQHYIPSSYLKAWCDPDTPKGYAPYVWQFSKDGNQAKKKAPNKIFYEKDLYTVYGEDGQRELIIEYNLSRLEKEFSEIRTNKLFKRLELTSQERLILCMFTAAMYGRTKTYGEHWSQQWKKALDLGQRMEEWIENATPEQRAQTSSYFSNTPELEEHHLTLEEVRELADNPIPSSLSTLVPEISPMLFHRPMLILETNDDIGFVTSDAPCVWYDPADYKTPRPFGAGGLISPTLEITLPLSPNHLLFFGKQLMFDGLYVPLIDRNILDSLNKRTRLWSSEYFVVKRPYVNLQWF